MNVYEKVSSLLSDEQKIATCARINQEIFSAVVDGTLPISKSTEGVIGDCLVLLTTKSLMVHHLKAAPEDHDLEDLEDNQKAIQAAKLVVLSEMHKQNSLQNILPTILSLKAILERERSVCVRNVMDYLRVLLQEYGQEKNHLSGIGVQTLKEIQYDIERFNKAQQEKQIVLLKAPCLRKEIMPMETPVRSTSKANFQQIIITRPNFCLKF